MSDNKIVFGTMRMCNYDYSNFHWVDLFNEMFNKGIFIHHISKEYESFKFYCEILSEFNDKYPEKRIKHIVKLAEPHFDSNIFDGELLLSKINEYRKALRLSNGLFGIQWMWRGSLSDDQRRCKDFDNSKNQIKDKISLLKKEKLIDKFYVFPYSIQFAKIALDIDRKNGDFFDGFIVYRNYMEQEYDSILNDSNKFNLVLRPLNAGKTLNEQSVKSSFRFAVSHKNVSGGIISISSKEKLYEILDV